jgi:NADH-quinone oxidoreductase subunit A
MELLLSISLFVAFAAAFVFINLAVGALVRPRLPNPEKAAPYECGEPTIGASWVQFDLRFYIVALVYLVFDVEVALFYPWAVAYGNAASELTQAATFALREVALVDMLFFFGVLLVGFAYLWRFGYLDWVRSAATTSLKAERRDASARISSARVAAADPRAAAQPRRAAEAERTC